MSEGQKKKHQAYLKKKKRKKKLSTADVQYLKVRSSGYISINRCTYFPFSWHRKKKREVAQHLLHSTVSYHEHVMIKITYSNSHWAFQQKVNKTSTLHMKIKHSQYLKLSDFSFICCTMFFSCSEMLAFLVRSLTAGHFVTVLQHVQKGKLTL